MHGLPPGNKNSKIVICELDHSCINYGHLKVENWIRVCKIKWNVLELPGEYRKAHPSDAHPVDAIRPTILHRAPERSSIPPPLSPGVLSLSCDAIRIRHGGSRRAGHRSDYRFEESSRVPSPLQILSLKLHLSFKAT